MSTRQTLPRQSVPTGAVPRMVGVRDPVEGLLHHPAAGRPAPLAATVEPLLVSRRQLAALLSVGVATLDRMKSAGRIPAPVTLSPGCIRWRLDTVRRWLAVGRRPLRNGRHWRPRSRAAGDL